MLLLLQVRAGCAAGAAPPLHGEGLAAGGEDGSRTGQAGGRGIQEDIRQGKGEEFLL